MARKAVLLGLIPAIALAASCGASGSGGRGGGSGGSGAVDSGGGSGGSGGSGGGGGSGGSGTGGSSFDAGNDSPGSDGACATSTIQAQHVEVAMIIALDRSSSMATNGKWTAAKAAIVQAMDQDAFDKLSLGLIAYPSFAVPKPPCLLLGTAMCGVPSVPDIPLANTGTDKSTAASGVRKDIASWLASHNYDTTLTDASPGYDAMRSAYNALRSYAFNGKRMLLFISDGGFSCTSVSNPTRPGYSDGTCPDWEYPDTVISLITTAANDPNTPVSTFIVGVPGSNSHGQNQGLFATAPYSMRLALSAYAYAGSPTTVPSTCDGTSFTKNGGDPSVPCHFDMTQGTFDAATLAGIIDQARGQAIDCLFALPGGDAGTTDPGKVNVTVTTNGTANPIKQAKQNTDGSYNCQNLDGWYYADPATKAQLALCPVTCVAAKTAANAKVDIVVGCPTEVVH